MLVCNILSKKRDMVVRTNFGKKKELINKRQNLINEQAC